LAHKHGKAIENEIGAQMSEQAEISEQRKDRAKYSKALETTEEERTRFREAINALPSIDGYDWGPRSAHVANKKYLLLKVLWASLQAEFYEDPEGMTDRERLQLVDAFFDAMRARLSGCPADKTGEPKVVQMGKVAEYVV
jgi:hypothetical protein